MEGNLSSQVLAYFSNLDQEMYFFWSFYGWTV